MDKFLPQTNHLANYKTGDNQSCINSKESYLVVGPSVVKGSWFFNVCSYGVAVFQGHFYFKMKSFLHLPMAGIVILTVVAVIFHLTVVDGNPVKKDSIVKAFYYLQNYGYIDKSSNQDTAQLLSEEGVTKAVKDFQVPWASALIFLEGQKNIFWGKVY